MGSDVGIKISKPGYDVHTAGDSDLIFSSAWPTLPVAFRGKVGAPGKIAHGLGFPPFSVIYFQLPDGSWVKDIPPVDEDYVFAVGSVSSTTLVYSSAYVVCYNVDLSKNREYPTFAPPQVQGGSSDDYGIKIAKEGESIRSHDMRDFILHSRCQSPLILTVMTEESPNASKSVVPSGIPGFPDTVLYTLVYTTQLTYPSWVFGYIKIKGGPFGSVPNFGKNGYYPAVYHSQSYPITRTDGVTTTLFSTNDGATILALRDPFFANDTVNVSY